MALSIFLAKLFGIYFIIVGLAFLIRRDAIRELVKRLKNDRVLLTLIALAEIVAGLAIALTHTVWSSDYRVVITIVGYWMVIEGILYIILSKKALKRLMVWFNHPGWSVAGGIISVVFGLYLACKGFGWWS